MTSYGQMLHHECDALEGYRFWGGALSFYSFFVHVQSQFQPLPTKLVFGYFDRGSYKYIYSIRHRQSYTYNGDDVELGLSPFFTPFSHLSQRSWRSHPSQDEKPDIQSTHPRRD